MKTKTMLVALGTLLIVVFLTFLISCGKEDPDEELPVFEPPTLTTMPVTAITSINALSGGEITNDGGSNIISKGIIWSTNPNPCLENFTGKTIEGHGAGIFRSIITNLNHLTTYYVKAYASNINFTAYGNEKSFITVEDEPGTVTDVDGNTYRTVIIGNQEWMAENLKTTKYRNGTAIEYPGTNNLAWENAFRGVYAWYDNDIGWKDSYGALYNWLAVNNSIGLCPTGWRVPSDADWTQLVNYVVEQGYPNNDLVNGTGNALKSCRQVSSQLGGDCATSVHPRWPASTTHYGTDKFGFSALPGGYRSTDGQYFYFGIGADWWSSSEFSGTSAWSHHLFHTKGDVFRNYYYNKRLGFSVRCVRD